MNIFYLDRDPVKAAKIQYNKHVVKMILESAQMLCTAHHHYDNGHNVPYKKAHYNHPSTIWCRQNAKQYMWLYNHMLALGEEYTKRYKKTHLTITKCKEPLKHLPMGIPDSTFTEPPQCMPDEYKVKDDSLSAYWNYYEQEKQSIKGKDEQKIIRPLN
ncbi:MAG: hypothetical protein DRO67_06550 [Candidatus Asgardarchaeum californiense]|nr:MAG: hypothetical protein DRO67_06550 [Candidatus Asgardarchaeum californiense]